MNTQRLSAAVLNLLERKRRPLSIKDMNNLLRGVSGRYALEECLSKLEARGRIKPGPPRPDRTWELV